MFIGYIITSSIITTSDLDDDALVVEVERRSSFAPIIESSAESACNPRQNAKKKKKVRQSTFCF